MHRRTVLRSASVALGTALGGCIDGTEFSGGPTESEWTPDPEKSTELMTDDPPSNEVSVQVTIQNRDDHPHSGTLNVSHVMIPACRYASPHCGEPSSETIALATPFDLESGNQRVFEDIVMGVGLNDRTVDAYAVEVHTDSLSGALAGLEAGAGSLVGHEHAGKYPWRVVGQDYQIRALLTSEGVDVAVRSLQ